MHRIQLCNTLTIFLISIKRLHKQLRENGKGAGANEWYFDLNHIMDVIFS